MFNKLKFEQHSPYNPNGIKAKMFFPNGYGVSVVGGGTGLYGDGVNTFELAVLKGNIDEWDLTYETLITNDVIGWKSQDEISELIKQVSELPSVV